MASRAAVLAFTGFRYSGVDLSIRFAATEGPSRMFWSNGYAWGTCEQEPKDGGVEVKLAVLHGELRIARLVLDGVGEVALGRPKVIAEGYTESLRVARDEVA